MKSQVRKICLLLLLPAALLILLLILRDSDGTPPGPGTPPTVANPGGTAVETPTRGGRVTHESQDGSARSDPGDKMKKRPGSTAPFRIHVIEAERGRSLSGVSLREYRGSELQELGRTDRQGLFTTEIGLGAHSIQLESPGYRKEVVTFRASSSEPIRRVVPLEPSADLTVRVSDPEGVPVPGAHVHVIWRTDADESTRWESSSLLTDDTGQAHFDLPTGEDYKVQVTSRKGMAEETIDLTSGQVKVEMVVEAGSCFLSGRVVDEVTRRPVPDASIVLSELSHRSLFLLSDSAGRFSADLSPGPWEIRISREGYKEFTKNLVFKEDQEREIRLTVSPKPSRPPTEVAVVDATGNLQDGFWLLTEVHSDSGTHCDQTAIVEPPVFNEYPVTLTAYDLRGGLGITESVTLEQHVPHVELELVSTGSLLGWIHRENGRPVCSFRYSLRRTGQLCTFSGLVAEDGSFGLESIPVGRWRLQIFAPQRARPVGHRDVLILREEVAFVDLTVPKN